ncbi:hypothetical protein B0H63DRAFT_507918 [Podospora didyma]|uniref:Uncharacterized protein n=1 Tax=Podospora didyma TaxID=330526 RepID=A0AAE0NZM9_9PEZI|nr:hypothetical protein B0H63DRAFT_507918 [Podospora didyma]
MHVDSTLLLRFDNAEDSALIAKFWPVSNLLCKETVAKGVKHNVPINYQNLGRCYTGLGRYSDAIECFNKAKDLFGPDPTFRYFVETGNLFMSIGNFAEAEDMFCKAPERLKAEDLGVLGDAATCLYKLAGMALRDYHASKREDCLDTTVKQLREAVTMMVYWKVADCELARACICCPWLCSPEMAVVPRPSLAREGRANGTGPPRRLVPSGSARGVGL